VAGLTPSQTIGPFFHFALPFEGSAKLASADAPGPHIRVQGLVCDGTGGPVNDALLEIWQADAQGRYHHPEDLAERSEWLRFQGFGRAQTDEAGLFSFETLKPGAVAGPQGRLQAPHLVLGVFARGVLHRLVTRVYFEDEAANARDPILEQVPAVRRDTLIARCAGEACYRFDVSLQGERETVFFDV